MTQAFNLSQLANLVNTSGQLNAATGLFNQVPVANGGTGKSSVTTGALLLGAGTSAMTELTGTTPGTVVASSPTGWTAQPQSSVGGGDYILQSYASPNVWTKPATIKAIKITVVGAGGTGGSVASGTSNVGGGGGGGGGAAIVYLDAPALPASPITVTAGAGTNSFGGFASATAGSNGSSTAGGSLGGSGGVGSGGINIGGSGGVGGFNALGAPTTVNVISGAGGASILGGGGIGRVVSGPGASSGNAGREFGGGGGGGAKGTGTGTATGGAGAPGIVIVEEFY